MKKMNEKIEQFSFVKQKNLLNEQVNKWGIEIVEVEL
jgi:IS605 OrfB family transposase